MGALETRIIKNLVGTNNCKSLPLPVITGQDQIKIFTALPHTGLALTNHGCRTRRHGQPFYYRTVINVDQGCGSESVPIVLSGP